MKIMKTAYFAGALAAALVGIHCGSSNNSASTAGVDENAETANAAGDTMTSADESSQGGGVALLTPAEEHQIRARSPMEQVLDSVYGYAYGQSAGCNISIQACLAGVRTGNVNCQINGTSLVASTTLNFGGPDALTCGLETVTDTVHRLATATLTRSNASVSVAPIGDGGQFLTRTSTGFTLDVLGVERKGTLSDGGPFFDMTSQTVAGQPLVITHSGMPFHRSNRVMNGTVVIDHKLAKFTTNLTANSVAWGATCNCATSGNFTATNTNGTAYTLNITGCGTGTLNGTYGDGGVINTSVTFDRCHGL